MTERELLGYLTMTVSYRGVMSVGRCASAGRSRVSVRRARGGVPALAPLPRLRHASSGRVRGRASSARSGVAQRLSATRFGLSPRHTQLNPGLGHFSTVIRAQFGRGRGWATGKSFAGERVVSARRRCGPRAPGEWRAPAPPLVAPRWKVKVSGGRGARWHISPTFAAVIHVASRSLPATPAPRTQRSRERTRARRCTRAAPATLRRGTCHVARKPRLGHYKAGSVANFFNRLINEN